MNNQGPNRGPNSNSVTTEELLVNRLDYILIVNKDIHNT